MSTGWQIDPYIDNIDTSAGIGIGGILARYDINVRCLNLFVLIITSILS